jgi:hypothetical protein
VAVGPYLLADVSNLVGEAHLHGVERIVDVLGRELDVSKEPGELLLLSGHADVVTNPIPPGIAGRGWCGSSSQGWK